MELTGRTYIFSAATLIVLAASLHLFDDFSRTEEGAAQLRAWRVAICDTMGIDTGHLRFGCHPDQIRGSPPPVRMVMRDGGSG